jgi:hypothetical protein
MKFIRTTCLFVCLAMSLVLLAPQRAFAQG